MFEELYAPLPDTGAYLERIGLAGEKPRADRQWLLRLVSAQLRHIPFDDMDVWARGVCPSLAVADMFEKIIVRRRGGYCYELNSLFCAFLKALGYRAYTVAVHIVKDRDYLPVPSHCAVVCDIGGEHFFCDVGFGGPVPDGAVPFDGETHYGYRVVKSGIYHVLESRSDVGETQAIMLFKDIPAEPVELIPLNYYTSQRPDSDFRSTLSLNLRLTGGSVTVKGADFRFNDGSERIERRLRDTQDLREILRRYFGMNPDEIVLRDIPAVQEESE